MLTSCGHGASAVPSSQAAIGNSAATVGKALRQQSGPAYAGAIRSDGSAAVCAQPRAGHARCMALVRLALGNGPTPDFRGYGPHALVAAYKLPASPPSAQTVAIVDAFDDPNAEHDLGVYRAAYGLPACTTANGCFKKVNQMGKKSPLPFPDETWAEEMSLDVDMVSAICPSCHILLVEAFDNSFLNLGKAVDRAATMGANAISNSYAGDEAGGFSYNSHYHHAGHMITAASGDDGFGPLFPADSQFVTAVGGTSLIRARNVRGWSETVWSGAGSGCSAVAPKPVWQTDPLCAMRTIADVAAVADPNTGVAVYDSFDVPPGFYIFGGTSVATPIIAAVYALAGNSGTLHFAASTYHDASSLFDVTSGSNGSCGGTYLCTGEPGYDGPTGNGTPDGTGAF